MTTTYPKTQRAAALQIPLPQDPPVVQLVTRGDPGDGPDADRVLVGDAPPLPPGPVETAEEAQGGAANEREVIEDLSEAHSPRRRLRRVGVLVEPRRT